jgi:ribonuclease PH
MNVVMTDAGDFVEVQGTGEGGSFRRRQLDALLDLADVGIRQLIRAQADALEAAR